MRRKDSHSYLTDEQRSITEKKPFKGLGKNNLPALDLIQHGFSFGKHADDTVTLPDML